MKDVEHILEYNLIFSPIKLLGKSTNKKNQLGKTTSKQKNPTLNIKTSDILLFFFKIVFTSNLQSIDALQTLKFIFPACQFFSKSWGEPPTGGHSYQTQCV